MNFIKKLIIYSLIAHLGLGPNSSVVAGENQTERSTSEPAAESVLDYTHRKLSTSLFYLSNRMDSFFGGERADDLPNASRVRLIWSINQEEGKSLKGEAALRLNIALVETQKKLKVSFKNKYEKEHEAKKSQPNSDETPSEESANEVNNLSVDELLQWRLKIDSGVRVDLPPDPFVRMSLLQSWHFAEFELKPSQQFFWYLKNGAGETTRLDLDRPLSETLLFRYENDVTWTDSSDMFKFYSGPKFFKQLSDNRGFSYGARLLGKSKPTWFVEDYRVEVTYRQKIYRKWFFVEVNPYIHFHKDNRWKSALGYDLRFEVVVGHL